MYRGKALRHAFGAMAFAAALAVSVPVAQASSLTDALEGDWSGSGRVVLPNGKTERIRCNGNTRSRTANTADLNFRCASTSGKNISFTSSLHFSGDRVRGEFDTRNRNGTVSGSATSHSVSLTLKGANGTGRLSVSLSGCTQTLSLTGFERELRSLTAQMKKKGC